MWGFQGQGIAHIGPEIAKSPADFDTTKFRGFIQRPFRYKRNLENIFYATLGYLIWDNVRMIREYEKELKDSNYARRGNPNADMFRQKKLERYLNKYKHIIRGLDDPLNFMNCDTIFVDEVKKCKLTNKRCNTETKQQIVNRFAEAYGVDRKYINSLSFSQLCQIQNVYNTTLAERVRQGLDPRS